MHTENILSYEQLLTEYQNLKSEYEDLYILFQNVNEHNTLIEDELQEKVKLIELAHKNISASVNYAQKIQSAILPNINTIAAVLTDFFIYYRIKDVVSGDFYWFAKKNNEIIIACVDCTGHGIPGAFMSFVGTMLLNNIVNVMNITEPAQILYMLNAGVVETLKQEEDNNSKDGMDIAICNINYSEKILQFASAYRPLYLFREDEFIEYKGNKNPVGGTLPYKSKIFQNQYIRFLTGENIYIFSDGYADQISEDGRKYKNARLKDFLFSIQEKDMPTQKLMLEEEFINWKGQIKQIDDILIIGIKL